MPETPTGRCPTCDSEDIFNGGRGERACRACGDAWLRTWTGEIESVRCGYTMARRVLAAGDNETLEQAAKRVAEDARRTADALGHFLQWSRDMWLAAHRGVAVKWKAIERELGRGLRAFQGRDDGPACERCDDTGIYSFEHDGETHDAPCRCGYGWAYVRDREFLDDAHVSFAPDSLNTWWVSAEVPPRFACDLCGESAHYTLAAMPRKDSGCMPCAVGFHLCQQCLNDLGGSVVEHIDGHTRDDHEVLLQAHDDLYGRPCEECGAPTESTRCAPGAADDLEDDDE